MRHLPKFTCRVVASFSPTGAGWTAAVTLYAALAIAIFPSCTGKPPLAQKQPMPNPGLGVRDQTTVAQIKDFQKMAAALKASPHQRGPEFDQSIAPETATSLLEAVINYEFDRGTIADSRTRSSAVKSIGVPISLELNEAKQVKLTKLVEVYRYLSRQCQAVSRGSSKIKMIDLVATENRSARSLDFKADVILLPNAKQAYPYVPNCNPFDNQFTASWSTLYECQPFGNPTDGPTAMNNRLNCAATNGLGCVGGYIYYANVQSVFVSGVGGSNPNALFYHLSYNFCDGTVLYGSQLNNFVSGCQAFAAAHLPVWTGPPPAYAPYQYNISPAFFYGSNLQAWWYMTVYYARPYCSLQYIP